SQGLSTIVQIMNPVEFDTQTFHMIKEADMDFGRKTGNKADSALNELKRSDIQIAENILTVPALGPRRVEVTSQDDVFEHLSLQEIFRLSWGGKNTHGGEWEKLKKDFEARLVSMKRDAIQRGWLHPQAVYGYFPAQAAGNDLLVYDASTIKNANPKVL